MFDLAIYSNRIITGETIQRGCVLIKDGVIVEVTDHVEPGAATNVINVGNKVLMAGIIDPHVHINEPGRTDWEGFDTATKAAIAGGLTSLVDMPLNSSPVTTTLNALHKKIAATQKQLHTNVGFWAGLVPGNSGEVEGLIAGGVLGFKAFLTHSGIDEFPNVTEDDLRLAMPVIARHNLPLLVHCELTTPNNHPTTNNRSYQQYLASRPKEWEDNAIAIVIRLCEEFNCHVHIVHLSSANSIQQIKNAKAKGLPLTVETGQHYLYFNAEDIPDGQTQYKCAPPIREKENNDQLWEALKDGTIDFVATDHSPATPNLKELESGNLMQAWGGIASLQFALPVLWTAAKKRNISLQQVSRWLCVNPAKLIGRQHVKGTIAKGYDADLVVWDPEESFTVVAENILHKHKITPYLNQSLYGVTKQTFIAGEKVFDKDEMFLNHGKLLFNQHNKSI